MKRESSFGAAALLAIAAVVGLSLQPGGKQTATTANRTASVRRAEAHTKTPRAELQPGCLALEEQLQDFLQTENPIAPYDCYVSGAPAGYRLPAALAQRTSQLRFVIALLPDPLHTHLSVLFDQFTVAIQEGAQDEKYDFDSSWLPWEDVEQTYEHLPDQELAELKKEAREEQPGILLFRQAVNCSDKTRQQREEKPEEKNEDKKICEDEAQILRSSSGRLSKPYRDGLIIFLVADEATHGIHKEQFRNALKWIEVLKTGDKGQSRRLGILGPTFSGSLPSLTQLLNEPETATRLQIHTIEAPLAIYSGSVSGEDSAETFRFFNKEWVAFHSFVQSDDEILGRFCQYLFRDQSQFDPRRVAILSEDETAYGKSGVETGDADRSVLGTEAKKADTPSIPDRRLACRRQALSLYYPRDISALRGAYQTRALFDSGGSAQVTDYPRRNLPTDLADPTGKVHDSIRSYGANQTPLVQEALLLDIVAALRDLHARYIVLRGSNTLDQLFLANFLRRMYPDGRVVILGSDLLFARERGATGLGGAMTLSTYPLFPLARDWTESESLPAADRAFSSDTAEGTYIALRTLLNSDSVRAGAPDPKQCVVATKDQDIIFLPRISCGTNPMPDYAPPYWMSAPCHGSQPSVTCEYDRPPTWLSVIGRNRFWPVASLTTPEAKPCESRGEGCTVVAPASNGEPGRILEVPREMKIFLIVLAVFAMFHACCCWAGSYTAKPNFRAYFATTGEWSQSLLVVVGSAVVACSAIATAWGCGAFSAKAYEFGRPSSSLYCAIFVASMALGAVLANGYTASALSIEPKQTWKRSYAAPSGLFAAALGLFLAVLLLLDHFLRADNRAFAYWRAMHLGSGVSALVPVLAIFAGLYLWFWFTLHGLALFGPDRPCLPSKSALLLKDEQGNDRHFLRMFSHDDAGTVIEDAGKPLNRKSAAITVVLFVLLTGAAWGLAGGVPIRGPGGQGYALFVTSLFAFAVSLQIAGAGRLYELWEELRRLLAFLDRLPLRRTLMVLRGFSWESVWKMSGNVLEVRYKVISRQMESMNHAITALEEFAKNSVDAAELKAVQDCLGSLQAMRTAGRTFADWYSENYMNPRAKDLTSFAQFQSSVADATGMLMTRLLVPVWIKDKQSLLMSWPKEAKEGKDVKEDTTASDLPVQKPAEHIRNAEEFVCLNYLAFIQNILGRLRTLAMSIVVLFLASTICLSSYPFDPRQVLSAVLLTLFLGLGIVIVKVYAEMHRDATLSHVTNTKPGELGTEFWLKLFAFGLAPVLSLLTRIFPNIGDFIFSWVQPSISSLR